MEICDLNSYTHDLINILYKQIALERRDFFIRKVWVCSHVVIGTLRGVGTYDFERNDGI